MSWRFRDRPRSTPAAPHEEVAQELELPGNDAKFLVGAGLMQPVDHRDLRMRRSGARVGKVRISPHEEVTSGFSRHAVGQVPVTNLTMDQLIYG